jgi:hypothetical protein
MDTEITFGYTVDALPRAHKSADTFQLSPGGERPTIGRHNGVSQTNPDRLDFL